MRLKLEEVRFYPYADYECKYTLYFFLDTFLCSPKCNLNVKNYKFCARLEIISVRVSEKARSGKFRHHIET